MHPSLTILIPTWDRPNQVNQRLQEINDHWKGEIPVKIQINPGQFSKSDIDPSLYCGPLEIEENIHNLGFVANVVLGMSSVQTEWVWILGDDDPIQAESAKTILNACQHNEASNVDAILFNQWSQPAPKESASYHDLETFMGATEFGNILFISGTVWRTSFFKSNLGLFIDYSYSRASQALILLANLQENRCSVLVINKPLINYFYTHRWCRTDYLKRIATILNHPSTQKAQRKIMTFLWPQCRWALQSAAHEQLKNGEITLQEWLRVASQMSWNQIIYSPNAQGLGRIREIWSILFQIYSAPQLLRILLRPIFRTLKPSQA